MKKLLLLACVIGAAIVFYGCGKGADENKTPAQIQSEVAKMDANEINAVVAKYQKAIEAKTAELKTETEKLATIPLTEQFGDEAKKVKENMSGLSESINKLTANMQAYADGLKQK
ncbi:MAG: hypothetical protein PHO45_08905 [Victivallaceae bacterium]|nr:hypothetical protein [Victivallaceae bacterium]MDD5663105.1 hypothetical protein [Victivallaceae bacterium]